MDFQIMSPNEIAQQTADLLRDGCVLIDLETTGLDDNPAVEVVEIAIIDQHDATLLNVLVKPQQPIPPEAAAVHGIRDSDVSLSDTFPQLYPQLAELLNGKVVVAYNYTFELNVLRAVCRRHNLPEIQPQSWWCAMRAYTAFRQRARYARLGQACQAEGVPVINAHRAVADCHMTLYLMQKMAAEARPTQQSLF